MPATLSHSTAYFSFRTPRRKRSMMKTRVITERPVTMFYRKIGRPSKSALWSTLYLGRAVLALSVQLVKRNPHTSREVMA